MMYEPNPSTKYKTMEEMMAAFYPESVEDMIQKADAPLLSSTTGWRNVMYGRKVWGQLNYEVNAFMVLPKVVWTQSGWRVETEAAADPDTIVGGVVENATITDSDTIKPTWVEMETDPKIIMHHFDSSELAEFESTVDDTIPAVDVLREAVGKTHVQMINEMLFQDNDTLAGYSIESLDRVVGSYSEITGCGQTAGDLDIYGLDRDTAATWADAVVNHNSDTDRVLTLKIIDDTLADIRQNGGEPKVILTGYDTLNEWQSLMEAQRRFLPQDTVFPSFNGVKAAAAGIEAGFNVAMYNGIPIIPAHRCTSDGISRIFFLDTDYLYLKVATPTQYLESRDMITLDRLGMRGAFRTMAELIATRFNCHGKIRDLKAA